MSAKIMQRNVLQANYVLLEEGEIPDEAQFDDNASDDIHRNVSMEMMLENVTQISSTSMEEDQEREVDRIICEVQEATSKGNYMGGLASDGRFAGNLNSTDEEEALRLAVFNSTKRRATRKSTFHHEAEEGEISEDANFIGEQLAPSPVITTNRGVSMQSSSHHTWVPLKRYPNDMSQKYGDMRNRVKNRTFNEIARPLRVTVRNENMSSFHPRWILNNQPGMTAPLNSVQIVDTSEQHFSSPFEEQLHRLRMRIEASKFAKKKENLADNYEQVGMDIVDSDRESPSRSSPLIDTLGVTGEVQIQNDIPSDSADDDEDVEQLRAVLLEQVMKRKNAKRLSPTLEDGELSSGYSEQQVDDGSGEGPSSSYKAEKHKRFTRDAEQSRQSQISRKRRKDEYSSSDSDDVLIQDYHPKLSRKARESIREGSSRRLYREIKEESGDVASMEERSVEDWERMVDSEKKLLKEIERKLRHRDEEKDTIRRKRENFLERANRCARQLGFVEAELEVLRYDQEKVKGRLSYLERQFEKAQFDESRRETERKAADREKRKKLVRMTGEVKMVKCKEKEVNGTCAPVQMIFGAGNDPEIVGSMTAHLVEQTRPLNTNIKTDYSDNKENVSRHTSSIETQHSSADLPREPELIELSDSSDSASGLISAIHELEQEELEANLMAVAEASSSPNRRREVQRNREINCTVTLCEKDINELRKNPLIMFSGYRICSSFPYHLIAHRSLSNKLDPLKPLCSYQLLGKCADPTCRMQHEEDYLMSDEELICSVLAHCPNLCPPKKMFSEFAREVLKKHRTKPVGEIIADLLNSVPESERRITVCEMAAKCEPPSGKDLEDDDCVDYEISQQFRKILLQPTKKR